MTPKKGNTEREHRRFHALVEALAKVPKKELDKKMADEKRRHRTTTMADSSRRPC